jgi:hypothetical protein
MIRALDTIRPVGWQPRLAKRRTKSSWNANLSCCSVLSHLPATDKRSLAKK